MPLNERQNRRIGRIAEKNPERAERVAERISKRENRAEVGKEIAKKYEYKSSEGKSAAIQQMAIEQKLMSKSRGRDYPLSKSPDEGFRKAAGEYIQKKKPMPNPAYDDKIKNNLKKINMQEAKNKLESSNKNNL